MNRRTRQDVWFDALTVVGICMALVVVLYPLIYIISASMSDPLAVNRGEMWLWPKGVTFEGYKRVFQDSGIWLGYRNTIFYTVVGTAINLLITVPGAYALARKDFAARNMLMALVVFTMFFSGGLIPTYLLVKHLGILDSVWSLLLPNAVAAWNVIVTRSYFQSSIPKELEEASFIDGCTNTRLFVSVILPLSAPILAVMALFYGVGHWNAYFNALIYLSDRDLYPLQLIIREILVQNQMSAEMLTGDAEAMAVQAQVADILKYAVMIVSALPVIIVYPFMQRYFVKGVMIGAIKG